MNVAVVSTSPVMVKEQVDGCPPDQRVHGSVQLLTLVSPELDPALRVTGWFF